MPPYLRVVDESACENDWNRRLMPSADSPMPVSRTANVSSACPSAAGAAVTVSTTSPRSVNFTALERRLRMIWRSRVTSPTMAGGNIAFEHVGGVEVLLHGAGRDEVERRLDAVAQVERLRLDVHAPGFDLREVEDVVDDREQRIAGIADGGRVVVLLGVELRVEQQAAHADHGVHRRADLVAHRREERALGLVGRLGLDTSAFGLGAGLLGFPEQPHVLDRDDRLVGEGLRERNVLRVELAGCCAQDGETADGLALAQQRNEQRRAVAQRQRQLGHAHELLRALEGVGDGDDARIEYAGPCATATIQRPGFQESTLARVRAVAGEGDALHHVALGHHQGDRLAAEELLATLHDGVEYRLRVGRSTR